MFIKKIIGCLFTSFYIFLYHLKYLFIGIHSFEYTIKYLISGGSIVRFGDGEFLWMSGVPLSTIEKNNENMRSDLLESFKYCSKKRICAINPFMLGKKFNFLSKNTKAYYRNFIINQKDKPKFKLKKQFYLNASISRYYIDSSSKNYHSYFLLVKEIFNDKKILIIEGENTKFGIGTDILSKASEVKRILCFDQFSYSKINEIDLVIKKFINNFNQVIFSLGPTAKILISKLIKTYPSIQFLDLGFLDNDYIFYLNKTKKVCNIENKKVFGAPVNSLPINLPFDKKAYFNQVIFNFNTPNKNK